MNRLGMGIGWRAELAHAIDRRAGLGFVELMAEHFDPRRPLPAAIANLKARGIALVPHAVGLSLGSADHPDPKRLDSLARLAQLVDAPLVSEHLSFVRAGGIESGHLLPLPRTGEMIDILVDNIQLAKRALSVPLALENVSTLFEWPHAEMEAAAFLTEVLERADVGLLLDVENVYADARNHGFDALAFLERIPLERIAYVHIAGGIERRGVYHDTHTAPVPRAVLDLLEELFARAEVPGVMLERDDDFPSAAELNAELDAIEAAWRRGASRRETGHVVS